MGLANNYSRAIRRQLQTHAAWLPVTNTFALGDFGVIHNGLFTRAGNIADLGVEWKEKDGPPSKLDYSSSSVTTVRVEAGVPVDAFSAAEVDAKLEFQFKRKATFVFKAEQIVSREIDDVFQVAAALDQHPQWRRQYRFVRAVYVAQNPLILASRESDTTASIAAKASVLAKVDNGSLSADVGVSANKELALEITGREGVIGLALAKVRRSGQFRPAGADPSEEGVGIVEDTDWDEDPEDDI